MSFLTRSNASLTDSSSIFGRLDDKSKKLPISQKSTDLVESLDDFRQGLRRQLTEKLSTGTHKPIDVVPSPPKKQSLKERFESNLFARQRTSPSKSDLSTQGISPNNRLSKPSEKKLDFAWDLTRKIEDRASPRKSHNRDAALLASLERKNYSSNALLSSGIRNSYSKRDKSPLKESTISLEPRTPNYTKTPQGLRSSFIDEGALSRTPQARKETLIKILDSSNTPKGERPLFSKGEADRPFNGITQQLSNLRASRAGLQQSPERREYSSTPTRASSSNLKTLTNFVNESFSKSREREGNSDKYATKKVGSLSRGFGGHEGSSTLPDRLPLTKLYELQDLFNGLPTKEFNNLSSEYVEELIKLSSVIMRRVKGSSYYGGNY